MKNTKKGSTTVILLVVIVLLLIGFVWYSYQPVRKADPSNSSQSASYKLYNFGEISFEYPKSWAVNENYYATPGQQDSGQRGDVEGLTLISPGGERISIGGRQAICRTSTALVRSACFEGDTPITTETTDPQTIAVFDHLVASMRLAADTSENYVLLVRGGIHSAEFSFLKAVVKEDIIAQNIRVCSVSGSAGTAGSTVCQPPAKYKIVYDPARKALTISEIGINKNDQDKVGIFRSGCASCTHNVRFSGIHTIDGSLLPEKTVFVY